jgi:hypothetical protein
VTTSSHFTTEANNSTSDCSSVEQIFPRVLGLEFMDQPQFYGGQGLEMGTASGEVSKVVSHFPALMATGKDTGMDLRGKTLV